MSTEPGASGAEIATFVLHGDRFGDLNRTTDSTESTAEDILSTDPSDVRSDFFLCRGTQADS